MSLIQRFLRFINQAFPPKSLYTTSEIPDLTGKVALVTGGNTGIGYYTVKALLEHNAKVYLAARNPEKAKAAIEKLKTDTNGKEAIFLQLDLAELKSVKNAAEEFAAKEKRLDMLFNNAGVMDPPISALTADGYDLQFGTNVLGHFYLTKLLLPILQSTAHSLPVDQKGDVRVVNTSSSGIYYFLGRDLLWNTMKDSPARRKQFSMALYSQSKVGNVLLANEFARRYGTDGIVSCSCNPGNLRSELYRHMFSSGFSLIAKIFLYPAEYGALTQLWAATSEEGRNFSGQFLIPWARKGRPTPITEDENVAKALWEWCEEQVSAC